ncbi:MAG: glycosyltransferase family 2 protein [Anaerolineae bacterium]|jgi:glycosyltransferase involved in cell wall biosynthesis|uniref:glycosyltransferase family 2 protein n=1 Tax=Candidatus Amarolinea dominans TaxID=3140696 RepID=UPI001DB1D506|nr:glycosyltransferase family 2 protein [Anaerolineae bacterium]MBK9096121.1 glycosyltransferase family 2 protein [Anaerolineae bacterium]MBK9233506.1 glycosyltransferase family 2 protein [Anaerolineae bacterium]
MTHPTASAAPHVSVVVPLYNEEESIAGLQAQLTAALTGLGRPFEIIVVDDGSRDDSFALLRRWQLQDPAHVRVVRFRRNFGQTAAFAAGFERARGEIIVTLDADLQNDPADIGLLLDKIAAGYDVVSGWRVQRQDAALSRRLPSVIANALISRVTGVTLHDYGCSLKAYRREVLQNVRLYGELHRFIPAIASWMGTAVAEIPVSHRPRQFGRSKYNLSRTFRVILDLITVRFLLGYATRPLHVFGGIGLTLGAVGTLIGMYLTYLKLILGQSIGSRPLLLLAVLLVVLGVQMLSIGLLGEMTMRTYYEAQNKPIYAIREILENQEATQEP